MRRLIPLFVCAGLACGGPPPETTSPRPVPPRAETRAELEAEPPPPEVAEPLALVPSPPPLPPFGARRGYPTATLVDGWRAALGVETRTPAPEPPELRSLADVQRWAETDFARWLQRRREAVIAAERALNEVARIAPPREQAVAAALVGWTFDRFAHDLAASGVVPEEILDDEELLGIYAGALVNAQRPLLQRAAASYDFCRETLSGVEAQGWWSPWRAYCRERAALLETVPASLEAAVIRERTASRTPPPRAEIEVAPLPALLEPAAAQPPRRIRDHVQALDALIAATRALARDDRPDEDWAPFFAATADEDAIATWPEPMRGHLARLSTHLAEASTETSEGREAQWRAVSTGFERLLDDALAVEGATRCWYARTGALGRLVVAHAGVEADHAREARREALFARAFEARQRAQRERASSLAALDGDALVQAGLLLVSSHEVSEPAIDALREAMRAYADAGDDAARDAIRTRGAAIGSAERLASPPTGRARAAALAADAERIAALFAAWSESPRVGARAVAALLQARDGPADERDVALQIDDAEWSELVAACR